MPRRLPLFSRLTEFLGREIEDGNGVAGRAHYRVRADRTVQLADERQQMQYHLRNISVVTVNLEMTDDPFRFEMALLCAGAGIWEGGTRGTGFLSWSGLPPTVKNTTWPGLMHGKPLIHACRGTDSYA